MTEMTDTFIVTKEYRRFVEFCDACRREGYIGLCYGPPGVGKTLSARRYARWDLVEPRLPRHVPYLPLPPEIASCSTVFYTPSVTNTPRAIAEDIKETRLMLSRFVWEARRQPGEPPGHGNFPDACQLLIVDEADRLNMTSLEQVRDIYDREHVDERERVDDGEHVSDRRRLGLVLIGMPGLEKRLARFPQLYSRVGFAHPFQPLGKEEMVFLLEHKWSQLGLTLQHDDFTDAEAVAAVIRITNGNLRLVQRLFTQIERLLRINGLQTVSCEVVQAARECLVIGTL